MVHLPFFLFVDFDDPAVGIERLCTPKQNKVTINNTSFIVNFILVTLIKKYQLEKYFTDGVFETKFSRFFHFFNIFSSFCCKYL